MTLHAMEGEDSMEETARETELRIQTDASRILIVDDDPDTCDMLATLFGGQGYKTKVAYTGKEALMHLEAEGADLVVLDVMMPGMDGWETCARVQAHGDIPVVFLTAHGTGEGAVRALALGAGDYIRKPFHSGELVARVAAVIKGQRGLRPRAGRIGSHPGDTRRPMVSVVIPTLNEARNLPLVLPLLPRDWVHEVILVDGGSTDGTVDVAKQLLPSVRVIVDRRPGKGVALLRGYRAAKGDVIVSMDADGSNDPREIPRFVEALMQGADFVKGTRFAAGGGTTDMPRYRKLGNSLFVKLVNMRFNGTYTDLCYGYNAFWRHCGELLDSIGVTGFEIEAAIYTRVLRARLRVVEVPSFEGPRFHGVGKLKTIPDGLRVLQTILHEWLVDSSASATELRPRLGGEPLFPPEQSQ
jgi:CheY-like chemotaxis protein